MRARGRKCAHSRKVHSREEDVHEEVPRVSLDCYVMNDKDRQNGSNPILIMIDASTGEKYSRAVARREWGKMEKWIGS